MAKTRRSGGGWGKMLLGFVLGVAAVGVAGFGYFKWTVPERWRGAFSTPRKPIADRPSFQTKHPAKHAAELRSEGRSGPIAKEPPFGVSEDVFEAGAEVYRARCAGCHGRPGTVSLSKKGTAVKGTAAKETAAAQFWQKGGRSWTAGEIYAGTAAGAPAKGMPAYRGVLRETALWQVSLLLANAGKPLPDPVTRILSTP